VTKSLINSKTSVSCFSCPDSSWITLPLCTITNRFPRAIACSMLWVTMIVVSFLGSTNLSVKRQRQLGFHFP